MDNNNAQLIARALDRQSLASMGRRQQLELTEALAAALEAAEAELTRRDRAIKRALAVKQSGRLFAAHEEIMAILAAAPVSLEAAHDSDCEADWGVEGQESPCRCNTRSLEAAKAETTTEWGVRWTQVDPPAVTDRGADEADVRRLVQALPDESEVVVREVTEWRPVSTEGDNRV